MTRVTVMLAKDFAVRRGVSPQAVSQWIKRGKLSGQALTNRNHIVVEEAERQLRERLDPFRGRPANASLAPPPAASSSPPGPDEPQSLAKVRLAREMLMLEAQQRAAAIERGELVRAAEVSRRWSAELDELLLSIEQFVVDLPSKLGLGRDAVDRARSEWREFRRRRAEQMAAASEG